MVPEHAIRHNLSEATAELRRIACSGTVLGTVVYEDFAAGRRRLSRVCRLCLEREARLSRIRVRADQVLLDVRLPGLGAGVGPSTGRLGRNERSLSSGGE